MVRIKRYSVSAGEMSLFSETPRWSPSGTYIVYPETERTPDLQDVVATFIIIQNVFTGHREEHLFPKRFVIASVSGWRSFKTEAALEAPSDLFLEETAELEDAPYGVSPFGFGAFPEVPSDYPDPTVREFAETLYAISPAARAIGN